MPLDRLQCRRVRRTALDQDDVIGHDALFDALAVVGANVDIDTNHLTPGSQKPQHRGHEDHRSAARYPGFDDDIGARSEDNLLRCHDIGR